MEDKENTTIHSNLLGALVYKVPVKITTVFTCNYCCFCWLCKIMKLAEYITRDVGSCCNGMYVFKLTDNSAYTDDLRLYKDVKEIDMSDFTEEEETQLIEMSKREWLYEKGLF